ncbi:MAG: polyphosphate kinase 2 family protein, partial [Candidatus Deferrimicrobiaceae bacterium]
RLEQPEKNWKFSPADIGERKYWDDYMAAYEDAIRRTASREAPWYVVPADNKWYTRLVVAAAIVEALWKLDLAYPGIDAARGKEIVAARRSLMREKR